MARTQVPGSQIADGANGVNLTVDVTGTLPVPNGGTGAATNTGLLVGNGTSAVTAVAAPSGTVVGTTDAQTLTNKAIDGTANTLTKVTGNLIPVQIHTYTETLTISAGNVTQIAGTTVQGYSCAVGDRILVVNAPAATGAATGGSISTQPGNGIYVVTNNTTNLTVSRASDMSGSVHPAGLTVYSEYNAGIWVNQSLWVVMTPATPVAAFTYGSTNMTWGSIGGRSLFPSNVYISSGQVGFYNNTPAVDTNVVVNGAADTASGAQTLTLPPMTTSLIDGEAFITSTGTRSLTSQTAAQKIFGSPTNGAVTLPAGSYFFDCFFSLSSMSATSGSFGFALGGTATIAGQMWQTEANKAALATAAGAQNTVNTAANTAIATATTTTTGWAHVWGKLRLSASGTVIPSVSLGIAAAAVVGADSYFRVWQVGSSSVVSFGAWT